jgi:hypothetical protein
MFRGGDAVWRLAMSLFCLIAALSGTPLRQAEAASDLARALAERDGGRDLETIDDGVGDDSETSIRSAGDDAQSLTAALIQAITDSPREPLIAARPHPLVVDRRAHPDGWLQAAHAQRLTWLQCFLF